MIRSFWAKKECKEGTPYWLPLFQHLDDTRLVSGLLWEHWLCQGQKRIITRGFSKQTGVQDVEEVDLLGKRVAMFLGAVHDIGKATPAFQMKKGYRNPVDLDLLLMEKLEREGFSGISTLILSAPTATPHTIAGQVLLHGYSQRFRNSEDIGSIVGGHHGKPIDHKSSIKDQIDAYPANYYQTETVNTEVGLRWKSEQRKIYEWALASNGFSAGEEIPVLTQPAQIILLGLLTMADWIASNTTYFPLLPVDDETVPDTMERCRKGFIRWKRDAELWDPPYISDPAELYLHRFGFAPRNVQRVFSEVIAGCTQPGIFVLEAPMGVGKTEAALVAAEQLAYKTDRAGLFFGLPTQATSNGIFPRIKKWLSNIYNENGDPIHLRLVHGKAYLNEEYTNLTQASQIGIDENAEGDSSGFELNPWFAGRKTTILDDFLVGTVDQFLLAALKQRHLALRHLGFSKKVVVIDEVHAYDTYMSQYLQEALTWMGAYGVPVILLSATLPKSTRTQLVKSYMKGRGVRLKESVDSDHYPLITFTDGNQLQTYDRFERSESKKIRIEKINENEIRILVRDLISKGGNIGIVVNTVKKAQVLAKALAADFGEECIELLHSAFIASERSRKEEALLKMIGNGEDVKRPGKKIVIGTQVIEQSLDIDFDVMLSELCPMDLLIQRLGRLHRHQRTRPAAHQEPVLYVFGTDGDLIFDSGSKAVYGGYLLTRTQYYLPDSIVLPDHISPLVEMTYGNHELVLEKGLQEEYTKYKQEAEKNRELKKEKARVFRLKEPVLVKRKYGSMDLVGWLENPQFNLSEERAYAQVRDSDETIEVIALLSRGSGYTTFGSNEDMSGKETDDLIAKKIASSTIKLPQVLCRTYNIEDTLKALEEYTLAHFPRWESSPWLKGTLGIIFDSNHDYLLNGYKLHYDGKYGLSTEKV